MSRDKDITLIYKWDKKTYIEGSKSLYYDMLRRSPKRFVGWIFIAMSQFGLVAFYKKGLFGLLLISTFLLIYWYILRWPIRKFLLINAYNKSPLKDKTIVVKISNKYIEIDGVNIPWSDIKRVLMENVGYLLYYQENYIFIPKDVFEDDQETRFLEIIKKNTKVELIDDRRK